jgi:hypothetical protein
MNLDLLFITKVSLFHLTLKALVFFALIDGLNGMKIQDVFIMIFGEWRLFYGVVLFDI